MLSWGGWGGWGGGGGGNLGVILVRVCEPVFQNLPDSYTWPSKKQTHSYTWSSKMLTYSYTALWFFLYPFFAGYYTNIIVNSCNTKRISSLEKSLSEKYVHIPGCQKNGAFHIGIQKNGAIHILFVEKKGGQSYTWQRWKRGLFGTHICTMPYIGSYPAPPSPPPPSPPPPPPPPHSRWCCFPTSSLNAANTIDQGMHSTGLYIANGKK